MQKIKRPKTREDLIRTEITFLSLLNPITNEERILSAQCVSRCNISHKKSLFEKQIAKFAESNYTVSEMAVLCNMSVTTFKKKFAKYYELPPHRWLVKLHLHKAMELLLSRDLSIKEICHICHFENQSHFTKHFRHEYGLTHTHKQLSRSMIAEWIDINVRIAWIAHLKRSEQRTIDILR